MCAAVVAWERLQTLLLLLLLLLLLCRVPAGGGF
jgi:hypothetical protein